MKTLIEAAHRFERLQAITQEDSEELAVQESLEQIGSVSERVHIAIQTARTATGVDLSHASLKSLPGDIAGQYEVSSGSVALEEDLLLDRDETKLTHVATHEAWHKAHHRQAGEVRIDHDFEEGLTELATAETTGETIAYPTEVGMVDTVASRAGTTRTNLVRLFKEGDAETLNDYHREGLAA